MPSDAATAIAYVGAFVRRWGRAVQQPDGRNGASRVLLCDGSLICTGTIRSSTRSGGRGALNNQYWYGLLFYPPH